MHGSHPTWLASPSRLQLTYNIIDLMLPAAGHTVSVKKTHIYSPNYIANELQNGDVSIQWAAHKVVDTTSGRSFMRRGEGQLFGSDSKEYSPWPVCRNHTRHSAQNNPTAGGPNESHRTALPCNVNLTDLLDGGIFTLRQWQQITETRTQ